MRSLFLLALVATTGHAQCVTRTAVQYRALVDSLAGRPHVTTLLDSAGITVRSPMSSAGASSVDGSVQLCAGDPVLRFSAGTIMLVDGSRPALEAIGGGAWNLLALVDRPWLDVNDPATWRGLLRDSVAALVNFAYPSWRAAVVALAPRFHTTAAPPVVVVPPVVTPPVVVPALTCDGHPVGYAVLTGGLAYDARRTERTTVVRNGVCLGVATLASPTRYAIHIRTPNGWRSPVQSFNSRAAAEAAIVAANGR